MRERGTHEPRRHPPQPAPRAWARARAASASTARPGSCTASSELDGRAGQRLAALDFLEERWKGVWPILYGDQLRQARLDDWIFQGLLDVEHLPAVTCDRLGRAVRYDVIVIGAGAGRADRGRAAGRGRREGHRARQGRRRDAPRRRGTIDVLGYAPGPRRAPGEAARRLLRTAPTTRTRGSAAPTRSRGGVAGSSASSSRPAAYTATAAASSENILLPTAVGARRPSRARARDDGRRATCAATARCCIVGFRALKDFHAALPRRQPVARGACRALGRSSSTSRSTAVPRPTAWASRGRFDDPERRAPLIVAELAARLRRRGARRLPRRRSGCATRTGSGASCRSGSGGRSSRSRRCRRRCPGMRVYRDAARRGCARAGGRVVLEPRSSSRANARTAASTRSSATAAAARATLPRRLGRARDRRLARAAIELDSHWRARETALGLPLRGVPGAGEPRFGPTTSTSSRWRAPASPSTRACARSTPTARACRERARRRRDARAAPRRGARSPATAISLASGHRAAELIVRRRREAAMTVTRTTSSRADARARSTTASSARSARRSARVSNVTPLFPGPKYVGPQAERFRTDEESPTPRSTTARAAASAPRSARRASTSPRSTRRPGRAARARRASRCATG